MMNEEQRTARTAKARQVAEGLAADGVAAVALTFVDNAGITRVKTVPVTRLEHAVGWGVGMSPVFDVFLVNDEITTSKEIGGPDGDLRLVPDLDALRPLAAQPGWAWAPVDRFTQDGTVYPACQRSFAARMVREAAGHGIELRMAFELEWALGREVDGAFVPACSGPAYGMTRLVEVSDYARDLLAALRAEGVAVEQFHPEYAAGQLEISVAPDDPVAAADLSVLVRQTIRAVAARHDLLVSFAPSVVAGSVGNGGHVHLSLWQEGRNLFAGGDGPYGMTRQGETFIAGVLASLPALVGVGAPSVASYLRLVPSHWAGIYQCWGRETRETAVRFITGMRGSETRAANVEVKCFDASANPYLVAGSLIAAGLAGVERGESLPPEMTGDPALKSPDELEALGVRRLPQALGESAARLERDETLRAAMGSALFEAFLAVRRAEIELFDGRSPEEIVAATRWKH